MTRGEKAEALFREGYTRSQAVVLSFEDVTGLDRETACRLSASFGGGMGRLREVCGGVSGMLMVAGYLYGFSDPTDRAAKAEHYALVQEMARRFRERNGSIICRELLGEKAGSGHVPEARTEEYYRMRPCERMVFDAAEILEEMLKEM